MLARWASGSPPEYRHRLRLGIVRAAGIVGAGMLLFTFATRVAPVVNSGPLPEWMGDSVERVSLLGWEVYSDRSGGAADALTALGMLAIAAAAAWVAVRLNGIHAEREAMASFALLAAGVAFLGLDELFAVHETLGQNLAFLHAVPYVDHPDDVLIGIYGLGALAFGWDRRQILQRSRRASRILVVAAAVAAAAVVLDLSPFRADRLEESLELVAAGLVLLSFLLLARTFALVHHRTQDRRLGSGTSLLPWSWKATADGRSSRERRPWAAPSHHAEAPEIVLPSGRWSDSEGPPPPVVA